MNYQVYGLTGRTYRPNYVSMINAERAYLPEKYRQREEKAYRERQLKLQQDAIDAQEDAATKSNLIGLGQLGVSTYLGKKKDDELKGLLETYGPGKGEATPSVAPSAGTGAKGSFGPSSEYGITSPDVSPVTGLTGNITNSFKNNWGTIAGSTLAGGPVGGELAAKYFGDNTITRAIGGGIVAGGLSYLSSGDPYAAGLSALFGGGLAALFG